MRRANSCTLPLLLTAFIAGVLVGPCSGVSGLEPSPPSRTVRNFMNIDSITLSTVWPIKSARNITERCQAAWNEFVTGILNGSPWALRMVDASGKLGSGIFLGALFNPGNIHECLAATTSIPSAPDVIPPTTTEGAWKPLYCDVNLAVQENSSFANVLPAGLSIHNGLCLPNACSREETRVQLKNLIPSEYGIEVSVNGFTESISLPQLKDYQIIILVIFAFFVGLTLVGTALEFKTSRASSKSGTNAREKQPSSDNSKLTKSLLAFSVISNTSSLLDTTKRKGAVDCLHGIRFLSMAWVVLGHSFSYNLVHPFVSNPKQAIKLVSYWTYMPLFNGSFSVDSFFVMSGLLVTYLLLKELDKGGGKFNILHYYLHRYLRLTPLYAVLIAAIVAVLPMLGSSPTFQAAFGYGPVREACKEWWAELLYIKNFWYEPMTCATHGWYLNNDMQFYLFTPLIILPVYHLWRKGRNLLIHSYLWLWILASVGATAAVLYSGDFSGIFDAEEFFGPPVGIKTEVEYYVRPWCRFGPYVIGIYAGYLLHIWNKYDSSINGKHKPIMSGWTACALWILMTSLNLAVLFGTERYMLIKDGNPDNLEIMSRDLDVWYSALSRNVWALSIAWVIMACHMGYGGPVNTLLSWKAFKPLSSLSYATYLFHLPIVFLFNYNQYVAVPVDGSTIPFAFVPMLVMSYALAYPLAMIFEFPCIKLEKIWLGPARAVKASMSAKKAGSKTSETP